MRLQLLNGIEAYVANIALEAVGFLVFAERDFRLLQGSHYRFRPNLHYEKFIEWLM